MNELKKNDASSGAFQSTKLTREDELLIDRLVDGELQEDERQSLLKRLEHIEDGWRSCALSFLEAQTFHSVFKKIVSDEKNKSLLTFVTTNTRANVKKRTLTQEIKRVCLVATAALVFIGATLFTDRFLFRQLNQSETFITAQKRLNRSDNNYATPIIVADAPQNIQETLPTRVNNSFEAKFNSPQCGLVNVSVPCTEGSHYDRASFLNSNTDVPPNIAEALNNSGGICSSRRDEYRFPLDDGRVLILPVDTYNVKYVPTAQVW